MIRAVQMIVVCVMTFVAANAHAGYMFVGTFELGDGPLWYDMPEVLTGQEAAALIFGGNAGDYAISTDDDTLDALTITNTAWVDGYGVRISERAENFKIDVGPVGYSPGDYSAYVHDHDFPILGGPYVPGNNSGNYINYVWRFQADPPTAATPEPASLALWGLGSLGLVFGSAYRRFRGKKSEPSSL